MLGLLLSLYPLAGLLLSVPARRIERDGGGNRHIQALAVFGNIDPHQPVAMTAGEMAEARPLGPYHNAEALDLVKRSDVALAVGGETRDLDAGLLKPLDGACQLCLLYTSDAADE